MSHPTYSDEHEDLAADESKALATLSITRKYCEPPGGEITFQGPIPDDCAAELHALLNRWLKEGKI